MKHSELCVSFSSSLYSLCGTVWHRALWVDSFHGEGRRCHFFKYSSFWLLHSVPCVSHSQANSSGSQSQSLGGHKYVKQIYWTGKQKLEPVFRSAHHFSLTSISLSLCVQIPWSLQQHVDRKAFYLHLQDLYVHDWMPQYGFLVT